MSRDERLQETIDKVCEQSSHLKDVVNNYITLKKIGVQSSKDVDCVVEQCKSIVDEINAIVSIMRVEV